MGTLDLRKQFEEETTKNVSDALELNCHEIYVLDHYIEWLESKLQSLETFKSEICSKQK